MTLWWWRNLSHRAQKAILVHVITIPTWTVELLKHHKSRYIFNSKKKIVASKRFLKLVWFGYFINDRPKDSRKYFTEVMILWCHFSKGNSWKKEGKWNNMLRYISKVYSSGVAIRLLYNGAFQLLNCCNGLLNIKLKNGVEFLQQY